MTTYADAGVNIDLGNDASKILYNASRLTWVNREGALGEVIVPTNDFSGLRYIDVSGLPKGTVMNIGFDSVGTKIEVAERVGRHETVGYDLFAMICEDVLVRGAEPVLVGSILEVNTLRNKEKSYIDFVRQLAVGYVNAACEAGVAVVNGEVAEVGARVNGYGDFNYNWGAGVVWFANKDKLFTGMEIKEGDSLIGLKEEGFRSNGLSLVRKIMWENHGDDWHTIPWKHGNQTLGDLTLTPSRIYTRAVVDMIGGYYSPTNVAIHGVAHITGGGIPEKLGRVLKPSGFGAEIDSPFEPTEFMRYVQADGSVLDEEAYKTWNMRHGMIIISPESQKVIDVAQQYGIEAKRIGYISDKPGIRIVNRGAFNPENCKNLSEKSPYKKLQGLGVLEF